MAGQDLRRLARRLMQAISIQQGRRLSLATYQVYSQRAGRMCTKYQLSEQRPDSTGRTRYQTILSTWQLPDVVKTLAAELQQGDSTGD